MAYSSFTSARLQAEYNLEFTEQAALFADASPVPISDLLREFLRRRTVVALRSSSEKARSELIIMPILMDAYEMMQGRVNIFSGVDFNVDEARGLAGYCDYLFSLPPLQREIQAPVVAVVEAKKENINAGIPQCFAELVAAQIFNAAQGRTVETLYGVVTNGEVWKFMKLEGTNAVIDEDAYFLIQPEKIVGILVSMLR